MNLFAHELSCLSNKDLFSDKIEKLIMKEKNKRLKNMPIGTRVITIQAGFSGLSGKVAFYVGCNKTYYMFSPTKDGESEWLVKPNELSTMLEFYW